MHTRDGSRHTPPPSIDLGTVDLSGPSPEGRSERVINACVQAVLATPAGVLVDRAKLTSFIETRFRDLFDGSHFDFGPVLRGLLKIDGVEEADLYVGLVNLIAILAGMDVTMVEPRMALAARSKHDLLEEARRATESARATFERRSLRARLSELERAKLGELMVARDLITEEQLAAALHAQQQHGGRLGTNLVQMGLVRPDQLAHFLSEQLDLPCVTAIGPLPPEVLAIIPAELAARHKVLPIEMDDEHLSLAMADPSDLDIIERIERETSRVVRPTVAPELVISYALARHYDVRQPARMRAAPHSRLMIETPSDVYEIADLAADFARADDHYDVLAMVQRYLAERYAVSAVFDIADGVVRGFAASGIDGDARRIRERFIRFEDGSPDRAWFEDVLGIENLDPLRVVTIVADDEPAVLFVANGPNDEIGLDAQSIRRIQALTSAAIRMVELRADILAVAG